MADEVDSARYPTLAAYIDELPDGLASYPECKAKGSLVLSALQGHDLSVFRGGLPAAVEALFERPPAAGLWVHGTMSDAVTYAVCDRLYPTEQEALEWTRVRTRKTANSKLYRAVARATGPWTLLRMATAAHGLFQKGTDLSAERTPDGVILRLSHPPYLHGGLSHRMNVPMFEEIILGVGGRDVVVTMTEASPTLATYHATWR